MTMSDVLRPEHRAEYHDFLDEYYEGSCYCSACGNPPCSWCEGSGTHAGNPIALLEDDDVWESEVKAAVREIKEGGDYEHIREFRKDEIERIAGEMYK